MLRAAAWTTPAIVVATASPASANASGTMAAVSASGTVGSLNLSVIFTVTFAGTSPGTHPVTFTRVTIPSTITLSLVVSRTIPAGGGSVSFAVAALGLNHVGKVATLSYTVTGHGPGTIPAAIGAAQAA